MGYTAKYPADTPVHGTIREELVRSFAVTHGLRYADAEYLADGMIEAEQLSVPKIAKVPIHGEPDVQCPDCDAMHYGSGRSTLCPTCCTPLCPMCKGTGTYTEGNDDGSQTHTYACRTCNGSGNLNR